MSDNKELKRRKSIAFILRRRKRGRKARANSGDNVKSWAEYSEVNFTPTGSAMPTWLRVLMPLGIILILFSSCFMVIVPEDSLDLRDNQPTIFLNILLIVLAVLCILAAFVFVVYAILLFYRLIKGKLTQRNE